MIILITGQPGSGKTLLAVDMLANEDQFKGRPLISGGVPDLTLPHEPVPPVAEWTEMRKAPEDESLSLAYFTFPPSAVILVDEAQRIYRVRAAASKVPPEVAAFETHRHTGVDFILITQHPGLIDPNIRKLVGRHIHIAVTPFGRYRYEWTKCVDPESKTERDIAARSKYKLPARSFNLYKSSELHTKIKARIPFYIWVLLGSIIVTVGIFGYIYYRITHVTSVEAQAQLPFKGSNGQSSSPGHAPDKMSRAEYLTTLEARVPGLYFTAPRYDEVTKPDDAPFPMACVVNHHSDKCRCIDQQGNSYNAPDTLCRQIVQRGIFKDYGHNQEARGGGDQVRASASSDRHRPSSSLNAAVIDSLG
ncbi:MAG: zonular occludens toxin domain-containing protein [Rhodocyclaceae bacterium]|nr:zonular occludens toxin domain-containing protein [Rhodocyclaceae bacterium]